MPQASPGYNLAVLYPEIAEQWHPTKNGDLTPNDVTPGSHKKIWWICNEGHEWDAAVSGRVGSKNRKGQGCPKCYKEGRKK